MRKVEEKKKTNCTLFIKIKAKSPSFTTHINKTKETIIYNFVNDLKQAPASKIYSRNYFHAVYTQPFHCFLHTTTSILCAYNHLCAMFKQLFQCFVHTITFMLFSRNCFNALSTPPPSCNCFDALCTQSSFMLFSSNCFNALCTQSSFMLCSRNCFNAL